MENTRLLDKSQENKEATNLLAEAGKYHAATSRAYYAVYQKIIYILKRHQKEVTRIHGRSIKTFQSILTTQNFLNAIDAANVANDIYALKELRKKCDYSQEYLMDESNYQNKIKPLINAIECVLGV